MLVPNGEPKSIISIEEHGEENVMRGDSDMSLIKGLGHGLLAETLSRLDKAPKNIESLDFETKDSAQFTEYELSLSRKDRKIRAGVRWVLLAFAGISTGLVAVSIDVCVEFLFETRYQMMNAVGDESLHVQALIFVLPCLLLASVAALLVCFVEPLAAGSGIPEVKCFLNGVDLPNVVSWRTLLAKAPGVMCSVSAGLPCGQEGPMIHSGAILGSLFSKSAIGKVFGPYRAMVETRDMVVAGAAAGVAAAFGAPIGGVLFAIEEGATHWNVRIMMRTFWCCMCALFTLRFMQVGIEGKDTWGTLGGAAPLSFGFWERSSYKVWELPIFMLMAMVGGLMGALFNHSNTLLTQWRMRHVGPVGLKRWSEALFVTLCIALLHFYIPVCSTQSVEFEKFDHTNALYWRTGGTAIRSLFHDEEQFDHFGLVLFGVTQFVLACWTYGMGVPSGLFVPSLLIGAVFGRLVGDMVNAIPALAGCAHPGAYALVGATAMLSGMARITISLSVILIEATGDTQWALPIFVTVMVAKWTGDWFTIGLYDIHIELKHVPMLEPFPETAMVALNARDVMSRNVMTLNKVEKVQDLLKILESCSHHGFPVIDPKNKKFLGTLQREMIHRVLYYGYDHGVYQPSGVPLQQPPPMVPYEHSIFSKKAIRLKQYPTLEKIKAQLSTDDFDKSIDLKPYLNRGCFTVPERASMARVYTFFRTMGLRHLPVVNQNGIVSGIITRKDLIIPGGSHASSASATTAPRSSVVGSRRASILSVASDSGDEAP